MAVRRDNPLTKLLGQKPTDLQPERIERSFRPRIGNIYEVDPDITRVSPANERDQTMLNRESAGSLIQSIQTHGQLEPAHGIFHKDTDTVELLTGSRRRFACMNLNKKLRVLFVEDMPLADKVAYSDTENEERTRPTPVERARRFIRLMQHENCTAAALAKQLGYDKSYVSHMRRAAEIPNDVLAPLGKDIKNVTITDAAGWAKAGGNDFEALLQAITSTADLQGKPRINTITAILRDQEAPGSSVKGSRKAANSNKARVPWDRYGPIKARSRPGRGKRFVIEIDLPGSAYRDDLVERFVDYLHDLEKSK